MVLAGLGTIGVAAWISLLDARGHQVEQNLAALQRRAVEKNSRALARLAFYRNHLHDSVPVTEDTIYEIPGGLGSATIQRYANAPLQNQDLLRYEKNGVVPLRAYTTDVQVDISDGVGSKAWQYQLKSYNPMLGGDLLVLNPPVDPEDSSPLVSGKLIVRGRAVFWDAVVRDYKSGLRADEVHISAGAGGTTKFLDSSDKAITPLNYPRPRQTSGNAGAVDPTYGGLDIVNSTSNFHNAYVSRIQATGPYEQIDATSAYSLGPGPATVADNPNDDALELEVQTQTTDYLMVELPNHYPLSSRILQAVASKTSPKKFKEDDIYSIFEAHIPVPDDALTALMGPYRDRIDARTDEFHRANGTTFSSNSDGVVRVFLESADLPHLILENTEELLLYGQRSNADAANAAALAPRIIAVPNTGGARTKDVVFEEQNQRRIVLAISTDPSASNVETKFEVTGSLAFPTWRTILELQNTSAKIDASRIAGVILKGGIRSNRPIEVDKGTLTLEREYEYEGFESLLSRSAWVEAYRQ